MVAGPPLVFEISTVDHAGVQVREHLGYSIESANLGEVRWLGFSTRVKMVASAAIQLRCLFREKCTYFVAYREQQYESLRAMYTAVRRITPKECSCFTSATML